MNFLGTNLFVINIICLYTLGRITAYQLPDDTSRNKGYLLEEKHFEDVLTQKLSPIENQMRKIEKIILGDDGGNSLKDERFIQKQIEKNRPSPHENFDNLNISATSRETLQMLNSMTQNPTLVNNALPPGIPPLTLTQMNDLISKSLLQNPNLSREYLEKLLENWKKQVMISHPYFTQSNGPNQPQYNLDVMHNQTYYPPHANLMANSAQNHYMPGIPPNQINPSMFAPINTYS